MPDPSQVIGLICRTAFDLQGIAPLMALVLIGFALLFALMTGGAMGGLFSAVGVLGAVGAAFFALVVMNLPSILGALGVPASACPWSI